ncbi:monocarboxylate transporter 9-like [Diorhabda carinulata]|uniref:monocarboxylate transporter 9-like n=1 Tax=Diorhabda carinulata TaxID=1163345 RepID=UPI0025A21C88|nr:monocarboxylate transporter 9-like [Diorhabda carinulata]
MADQNSYDTKKVPNHKKLEKIHRPSIDGVSIDDDDVEKLNNAVPIFSPTKAKPDLVLNEKNVIKKQKVKNNNVYANPISADNMVTEKLLNCKKEEDEKPVLHVQFNGDNRHQNPPVKKSSSVNSDISSSSSDSSEDLSETRPPDGGWGWVIVLASFVVNLIADGITFSFGVIFVEFLNYFGEDRGTTAWVGGLFMAMPLLSGPVASFLTDRYGCRKVTVFGALMASIGFVISSMANSMVVLCITFGVISGFGLSLCYVASVVIVAYYFDKKRSFATGLAVCGSGIGTFIFAPLIQFLLDEYGWRGTTLILAGLFLNLIVCGALMRDLPWTSKKQKRLAHERRKNRYLKRKQKEEDSFPISNSSNTASMLQTITEEKEQNHDLSDKRLSSSLVHLPTYIKNGEKVPLEVLELLARNKAINNVLITNYPNILVSSRSFSDSGKVHEGVLSSKHAATHSQLSPITNIDCFNEEPNSWLPKKDEVYPVPNNPQKKIPTAYLRDLRIHRLSVTYRGAMLNIKRYRLRASSCPDIYRNSMTTIAEEKAEWYAGIWDLWDLLVDMFDFSYFADAKFCIFAVSNFLLYTWYDVPYVYLTDNARKHGYSEKDASLLISIIGIINMFGEIILGWAGDRRWANASIIYAACMVLCGGVIALVPIIVNYPCLLIVSGAFGFFIAANYSLTCIILVELITLDRFTNAYGLLLLVQGVANLVGPPIAGRIYDITGTYDMSFYLAGFFIAVSGLLLVVIPVTNKYKSYICKDEESLNPPVNCDDPNKPKK